jgi:hypothetical protein
MKQLNTDHQDKLFQEHQEKGDDKALIKDYIHQQTIFVSLFVWV